MWRRMGGETASILQVRHPRIALVLGQRDVEMLGIHRGALVDTVMDGSWKATRRVDSPPVSFSRPSWQVLRSTCRRYSAAGLYDIRSDYLAPGTISSQFTTTLMTGSVPVSTTLIRKRSPSSDTS